MNACKAKEPKIEKAKRLLECANQFIDDSHFKKAIKRLHLGITLIGSDYSSPETIDDTDQKIALANFEEDKKRYSIAANLLRNVLADRLSTLAQKSK